MYGPLALLVGAVAVFTAGLVRWRLRQPDQAGRSDRSAQRVDLEQVQGFVLVGAGALVVLAVAVLVLGSTGRPGPAEATGVLGLVAYLVYLALAMVLIRRTASRSARRAS